LEGRASASQSSGKGGTVQQRSERVSDQLGTKEKAVSVDRIGVHAHVVAVVPLGGPLQQKGLARLDVMERELRYVQAAVKTVRRRHRTPRCCEPGAFLSIAGPHSSNELFGVAERLRGRSLWFV